MQPFKQCNRCGEWKHRGRFYVVKKYSDHRKQSCDTCTVKYAQESKKRSKHVAGDLDCECKTCECRRNAELGLKRCPSCEELVPFEEYSKNIAETNGLGTYCLRCLGRYMGDRKAHEPECDCKTCWAKRNAELGLRRCPRCTEVKPFDEFYRSPKGRFAPYCIPCNIEFEDETRLQRRARNHGTTKEILLQMYEEQDFSCGSCHEVHIIDELEIDHDHACCPKPKSCGKCIRKLLCVKCNRALGLINDDLNKAIGLVEYIQSFQKVA